MHNAFLALMSATLFAMESWGASYYTVRPDDPKAVWLTKDNFAIRGNGVAWRKIAS